jgi:sec-independent protein translocase protein TatA
MPNIGAPELAIILVIVLVIFGPKRLPGLGRQLGTGMREFKDSITGATKEKDEDEETREPAAAPARELDRTAPAEPEVLTGEAQHEDELARRGDA